MIPWMREKLAERRAKWEASRKRVNFSSESIGISNKIPLRTEIPYGPILLKIISYDGRLVSLRLLPTTTIQEVKCQALTELGLPIDEDVQSFKLLKPSETTLELKEDLSISKCTLAHNDELLLMRRDNGKCVSNKYIQKGPSQSTIDELTVEGMQCGQKAESVIDVGEIMLHCDVQSDIRHLLISLAKSSAFVIGAGPYATQIILMFKERLIRRNSNDLFQLDAMSQFFVQEKQLSDNHGNVCDSKGKLLELNEQFSESKLNSSTCKSTKKNIEALLEIIRIYSYKHITTKSNLKEVIWNMGFSKQDVANALEITENNYVDACKRLMRIHNKYNDGLLKDSPMLQALITSPHIQLSFSNPKIFIAYLSILDDYSSINLWLSDAETAGVIGHVLRTYHEEKHILAINRIS
ncbi:Ubiquitin-associated domain-containing protein 1 [Pseudolycoriella hygida]|uniref:Ubiquitin-associated domain-containing protein 1 n=1 Tax=Pseudolycoriella hygida TaxID=35572 RepID=A0A9Q0NBI0_9DIPT|nr:Ubiquitin-associated domain-containing protein 1 [Pseudolycoriella hygida]